ncbi:hypothetical protein GCM10029964_092810 [Kibdelosporangium lantanae]
MRNQTSKTAKIAGGMFDHLEPAPPKVEPVTAPLFEVTAVKLAPDYGKPEPPVREVVPPLLLDSLVIGDGALEFGITDPDPAGAESPAGPATPAEASRTLRRVLDGEGFCVHSIPASDGRSMITTVQVVSGTSADRVRGKAQASGLVTRTSYSAYSATVTVVWNPHQQ